FKVVSIATKSIFGRSSIRSKVSVPRTTRGRAASLTIKGDVIGKGRPHGARSCRRRGRLPVEPARRTERAALRARGRIGVHARVPQPGAIRQGPTAGTAAVHRAL